MFMKKTSPNLGDAMTNYEVVCPKRSRVSDFLDWGASRCSKEFGDIHFGKFLRTHDEFKYSNFKDTDLIREKYGDRLIKSPIKCHSGWGRIDYWIELEPDTLKNKNFYKDFLEKTKIDPSLIDDWRPCEPLYDVPRIPLAIVIWMKDGTKLIYIHKEEEKSE